MAGNGVRAAPVVDIDRMSIRAKGVLSACADCDVVREADHRIANTCRGWQVLYV
jgi:hypothetical protein